MPARLAAVWGISSKSRSLSRSQCEPYGSYTHGLRYSVPLNETFTCGLGSPVRVVEYWMYRGNDTMPELADYAHG